jgi:hypothetical protein
VLSPERKPTIENVGAQRQEIPPVNTIVLIGNLTKNPGNGAGDLNPRRRWGIEPLRRLGVFGGFPACP